MSKPAYEISRPPKGFLVHASPLGQDRTLCGRPNQSYRRMTQRSWHVAISTGRFCYPCLRAMRLMAKRSKP